MSLKSPQNTQEQNDDKAMQVNSVKPAKPDNQAQVPVDQASQSQTELQMKAAMDFLQQARQVSGH